MSFPVSSRSVCGVALRGEQGYQLRLCSLAEAVSVAAGPAYRAGDGAQLLQWELAVVLIDRLQWAFDLKNEFIDRLILLSLIDNEFIDFSQDLLDCHGMNGEWLWGVSGLRCLPLSL